MLDKAYLPFLKAGLTVVTSLQRLQYEKGKKYLRSGEAWPTSSGQVTKVINKGKSCWQHVLLVSVMRVALYLCGLPTRIYKPRFTMRKTSDKPKLKSSLHNTCPAVLKIIEVTKTSQVGETLRPEEAKEELPGCNMSREWHAKRKRTAVKPVGSE